MDRRGLALVPLLMLAACSPPTYGEAFMMSFRRGQRAMHAGRHQEAATHFQQASMDALRYKDREEALYLKARALLRLEKTEEALVVLSMLAERDPAEFRSGRASYDRAALRLSGGDTELALKYYQFAIEHFPDHGGVHQGVSVWSVEFAKKNGEPAARRQLQLWAASLAKTDVAQSAKYQLGRSYERSDDLGQAHDAYVRVARDHPYPLGSLHDDALFRAAELALKIGKPRQAVTDLQELLSVREGALALSYERGRFPAAQYLLAEIYRDRLGDSVRAETEFAQVASNHPNSTLADDGLWNAALLAKANAREESACKYGEQLAERVPVSRYRRCLGLICGQMSNEASCPNYIRAQATASKTRSR